MSDTISKPSRISERQEVTVETDEGRYQFVADRDAGRLVIQQQDADDGEICSVALRDPEEIAAFFEGLSRIFGRGSGWRPLAAVDAPEPAHPAPRPETAALEINPEAGGRQEDREEIVERARARNANAFSQWTGDEEALLRERFEQGWPVERIAASHGRSPRAIRMRLEKLGVDTGAG